MTIERNRVLLSITLLAGTLGLGCADAEDQPALPAATGAALPEGHVPIPQNTMGAPAADPVLAVVNETMDGGGYTYVRVDADGDEAWIAGPLAQLAVGDTIALLDLMPMENFSSTSLNRTFEVLYFTGALQKGSAAQVASASEAAPGTMPAAAPGAKQSTASEVLLGGGYTYVQVEVDGESLWIAGPQVAVQDGQTVSWSGGTMMTDFHSSTLDRTFGQLLFVERITVR